jgi:hypothetical protein
VLITFSGLDGAGKSTLIAWLKATLEQEERPVAVLHINTHVGLYAYARFFRDEALRLAGVRTPPRPAVYTEPAASNGGARGLRWVFRRVRTAVVWSKVLRQIIYPIDLLLFVGYRLYVERLRKRILIMDRYFYDSLVDVANGRNWGSLRLLERITPTPDVALLLDVPPERAYGRKREQPYEYLERRWRAYQVLFPLVRTAVLLPNHDLGAAKAALYRVVTARLPAP